MQILILIIYLVVSSIYTAWFTAGTSPLVNIYLVVSSMYTAWFTAETSPLVNIYLVVSSMYTAWFTAWTICKANVYCLVYSMDHLYYQCMWLICSIHQLQANVQYKWESPFVTGMLWQEIKQVFSEGLYDYFDSLYNYLDVAVLTLYLSSFTLKYVCIWKVNVVPLSSGCSKRIYSKLLS